ncbi:unnamed protein product [Closterium sp. NIES-53]
MSRSGQAPDLKKYMDKKLNIKLNANRTVVGVLRGFDQFMNLVLDNTVEMSGDDRTDIGMVVIRGNSVIMIEALESTPRATYSVTFRSPSPSLPIPLPLLLPPSPSPSLPLSRSSSDQCSDVIDALPAALWHRIFHLLLERQCSATPPHSAGGRYYCRALSAAQHAEANATNANATSSDGSGAGAGAGTNDPRRNVNCASSSKGKSSNGKGNDEGKGSAGESNDEEVEEKAREGVVFVKAGVSPCWLHARNARTYGSSWPLLCCALASKSLLVHVASFSVTSQSLLSPSLPISLPLSLSLSLSPYLSPYLSPSLPISLPLSLTTPTGRLAADNLHSHLLALSHPSIFPLTPRFPPSLPPSLHPSLAPFLLHLRPPPGAQRAHQSAPHSRPAPVDHQRALAFFPLSRPPLPPPLLLPPLAHPPHPPPLHSPLLSRPLLHLTLN